MREQCLNMLSWSIWDRHRPFYSEMKLLYLGNTEALCEKLNWYFCFSLYSILTLAAGLVKE